jgi:hypothetical protein
MKIKVILILSALIMAVLWFRLKNETYRPLSAAHRLGFIDSNPARRVSGPFDGCSPENWQDCKKKV